MVEFEKFPKIQRLKGIRLVITEKIDGTNAQVYVPQNPEEPIQVGSRNRWITPGKSTDNYGFAEWALEREAMLRRLGPGRHFGEWWGLGIGPRGHKTPRKWSLFNALRYLDDNGKSYLPEPLSDLGVGVVPILYNGEFSMDAVEAAKEKLRTGGSLADPGHMNPEGIVCKVLGGGSEPIVWKFCFENNDSKLAPSPEQKLSELVNQTIMPVTVVLSDRPPFVPVETKPPLGMYSR